MFKVSLGEASSSQYHNVMFKVILGSAVVVKVII